MARNLNASLRRVGEPPATIYVPDKLTLVYLSSLGEPCVLLLDPSAPRTDGKWMDSDFHRIVQFKLRVLGSVLKKATEPVFFVDPDVVFLRRYSETLSKIPLDADFTAQANPHRSICMGVVIINPNERTRAVFPEEPKPCIDNDETHANWMITENGLSVTLLDDSWRVGALPFDPSCICYHFNYRVGLPTKMNDMRASQCWFADSVPITGSRGRLDLHFQ